MALLEGDERSEMPSMSWNSVVKERTATTSGFDGDAGNEDDDRCDPSPPPAVAFSTSSLAVTAPSVATRTTVAPTPVPPTPVAPTPAVAPAPAPTPTIAATPVPAPVPVVPTPVVAELEVLSRSAPPIVAVAPPESVAPVVEPVTEQRAAAPEPAAAQPAPINPTAAPPNQSMRLPTAAGVAPQSTHRAAAPAKAKPQKQRKPSKDRSGSIARVGFLFLIVGALVSGAVIFGRPYLFPADWEANALEFAEPIETARGIEFVEPVLLTPQSSAVHGQMVAAQLLGDPAENLPTWRALGLAGPDSTDDATLRALISEQSPVLYSTLDGQVYYDSSFTRSDRSALISQAMATAALDQEFSFSADAPNRSLDDAALTDANVRQQAALIAQSAAVRAPLPTADMAALAFLPSVLDYRLTASVVFADLLPPVNDVASNPLSELGTRGSGPLQVPPLVQTPSNSLTVGDTVVGSSIVTDRSFWYMSFASHLDATTAYQMSNQLRSAGLQMVDGPTGRCAVATFATADATTNAALQTGLDAWVAASAVELGATVSALPDTTVQLRSCDPTGVYTSNIRFGGARQLIAWRSVELAVTNLVVAQGGTQAEIGAALARVGSTPTAVAVAQLPAGTAPADLAVAAQAAASDVIAAAATTTDAATSIDQFAVEPAVAGEG
jgi:hypothetical protein